MHVVRSITAQVGRPKPGPSGWAHAGPKWVGPSWAQARNLGPKKIKQIKNLKIKICSAQNVDEVWISRKKNPPGPVWGPLGPFFARAGKIKEILKFCLFSLVGPWALSTIDNLLTSKTCDKRLQREMLLCRFFLLELRKHWPVR